MNWRHVLGVLAGVVIVFVLTLVIGLIIGIVLAIFLTEQGASAHQAVGQMDMAHLSTSLPILLLSLGVGSFIVLLGGLLAGWIAGTGQVMTGLATGIVSTLLSFPLFFLHPYPLWYEVVAIVLTIGPAAMGGYVARILASLRRVPLPAAS